MSSGKKKPVKKVGLRGKDLKASHDRTEGLLGANHQKDTDESQAALKKGQADLDESRAEIMRQVMAYDKQQRAQDKAQDEHDNLQKTQASEMKGLRKAHQDIQDEDAQQPPDEDCETPAP